MSQVGNTENRFGGEYMIQDSDHMSGINQPADKANRGTRQADQSHSGDRQQGGGDQNASSQQGGERRRQRH